MATVDSVLWLISHTVENLGGLRSASVRWIISTATPQDTFRMSPSLLESRYLCRVFRQALHILLGQFWNIASG